ncbi:MAG: oligosaccharide flippase family protein [Zoogloeaceae bacterium]|nr:oligosaccharide flippase family protein [Zoogloeaceae bacterium]
MSSAPPQATLPLPSANPATRKGAGTISHSILWLVAERIVTTFAVFGSNVIVIRHLGPEDFGHLALFQVALAILTICTDFGLRRVFLSVGRSRGLALITAATLRLKLILAVLASLALLAALSLFQVPREYGLLLAVILASPLDVHVYRFEARLRNDLLARIRVAMALLLAGFRVGLCWSDQGLAAIAATYVLPAVALNLIVAALGRRLDDGGDFRATPRRLRRIEAYLARRSLWGFAAALVQQLAWRTDQLLVRHLGGPEDLGLYAAAYKFIEQMLILVMMVNGILLPALSRRSTATTEAGLRDIYFVALLGALAAALILGGGAPWIIRWAFGAEFAPAAQVLAILALALPGLVLATVGTLYYSLTGADAQMLWRALTGLLLAGLACALLIPPFGAVGAAWSVVASQCLAAFVIDALIPATRRNNTLKLQAVADLLRPARYRAIVHLLPRRTPISSPTPQETEP